MEVRPIQGVSIRGELRSLDGRGIALERTAGGLQTVLARDCVAVRFLASESRPPEHERDPLLARAELVGGDALVGSVAGGEGDHLALVVGGKPLRVPIDGLRSLVFLERRPRGAVEGPPLREGDRLQKWNPGPTGGDGTIEPVNGTVLSFQEKGVEFEGVFGKDVFPYDRVSSLQVSPLGGRKDPKKTDAPEVAVSLLPEGTLRGSLGAVADGALGLENAALGAVSIPLRAVASVRFRGPRFVELSTLDPAEVVETPYFGGDGAPRFPWRRDRSVGGGALRVGGTLFDSGLGVHSRSSLAYALDGGFALLRSKVGIDDETLAFPRKGSVVFRVLLDGKKAWESPVVRSGDRALELPEIDLRGVKRLVLEVDYADGFDISDRADWLEPILIREGAASVPASR